MFSETRVDGDVQDGPGGGGAPLEPRRLVLLGDDASGGSHHAHFPVAGSLLARITITRRRHASSHENHPQLSPGDSFLLVNLI